MTPNWDAELEMELADRIRFLGGPYRPPAVGIGDIVECEIRGPLIVRKWSKGRIPWPLGHRRELYRATSSFILCGDLIAAVQEESSQAICYWWGVSGFTVSKWRHALGIGRSNPGSKRLFGDWMEIKIPPEKKAVAVGLAHSPENIARVVETRRRNGNFANQKF